MELTCSTILFFCSSLCFFFVFVFLRQLVAETRLLSATFKVC